MTQELIQLKPENREKGQFLLEDQLKEDPHQSLEIEIKTP
jgi:hypothetical protein